MTWALIISVGVLIVRLVSKLSKMNEPREVDEEQPRGQFTDLRPHLLRRSAMLALRDAAPGGEDFNVVSLGSVWAGVAAQFQKDGEVPIPNSFAKKVGHTPEQVWADAIAQLEAIPFRFRQEATGLWSARTGDGLDPARLLCTSKLRALKVTGTHVAIAPSAHVLLVADSANLEALRALLDVARREYEDPEWRTMEALEWVDGAWRDFRPVPPHPLAAAFRAAAAKSVAQGFQDLMHFVQQNDVAPAAHLAPLSESDGGELLASWVKGSAVLMPKCDRVVLLDPEANGEDRRVELPWNAFVACFDWMLAGDEDTAFYRTRGALFPTVHQRAFARRAQAIWTSGGADPELPLATRADLDAVVGQKGAFRLTALAAQLTDGRFVRLEREALLELAKTLSSEDEKHLAMDMMAGTLSTLLGQELENAEGDESSDWTATEVAPDDVPAREANEGGDEGDAADEETRKHDSIRQASLLAMKRGLESRAGLMSPENRARLMPILRPRGHQESNQVKYQAMAAAQGLGLVQIMTQETLSWPMADGMTVELVIDNGRVMAPIDTATAAGSYGEELRRAALCNLEGASLLPMTSPAPGAFVAQWSDGFRASRLLLPALVDGLRLKGTPIAFTPTYDAFIVAGLDDLPALQAALTAAENAPVQSQYAFREALTAQPWKFEDGRWVHWRLPEGHPLSARVEALEHRLDKQRREAVAALAGVTPQNLSGAGATVRA